MRGREIVFILLLGFSLTATAASPVKSPDFRVDEGISSFAGEPIETHDFIPLMFFMNFENRSTALRPVDDKARVKWVDELSEAGRAALLRRLGLLYRESLGMSVRRLFALNWIYYLLSRFEVTGSLNQDYRTQRALFFFELHLRDMVFPNRDYLGLTPEWGVGVRIGAMRLLVEVLRDKPVFAALRDYTQPFFSHWNEVLNAQWYGGLRYIPEDEPELLNLSKQAFDLLHAARCESMVRGA